MAVKFDFVVFLESVGAEGYAQDLLQQGVDTLDELATLRQEGWHVYDDRYRSDLQRAVRKAERLVKSSDSVVQEELLVRDTNLILDKKDRGLSVQLHRLALVSRCRCLPASFISCFFFSFRQLYRTCIKKSHIKS